MGIAPQEFRDVMSRLSGGVSVVTATDGDGHAQGLTATAVCSVSVEPPLVLACLGRQSQTHAAIGASGRYALNFLSTAGRELADRFASSASDKFDDIGWDMGPGGCPLLEGALAWVECEVHRVIEAGDHTIFIGLVPLAGVAEPCRDPLLYFRGRYRTTAEIGP